MSPDHEELRAAVAESAALNTSVEDLTAALVAAAERDRIRWRRVTALLLVVLIGLGLAYWRQQVFIGRGLSCLLGEMAEHRDDNHASHVVIGQGHQLTMPDVPPLPRPPAPGRLVSICEPFYGNGR